MNILSSLKYIKNFDNIFIILIWFLTNYIFTIHNKKLLNFLNNIDIVISMGLIQIGFCLIYGIVHWIILDKKISSFDNKYFNFEKYLLFGSCNILCHVFSIYSNKINSLSYHQIIKSIEPIFIIFFNYLFNGDKIQLKQITFVGLIIFGGILSSLRFTNDKYVFELNWIGLMFGMLSNFFSCMKLFLAKSIVLKDFYPNNNSNQRLTNSINHDILILEYNLVNLFSFIIGLPICYLIEGNKIKYIKIQIVNNFNIFKYLISSSISFYFFNYYSIHIFKKTSTTGQMILGIIKKIIIFIISFIFFDDEINFYKILGICMCILAILINYIY